jgi:hypothetical protein
MPSERCGTPLAQHRHLGSHRSAMFLLHMWWPIPQETSLLVCERFLNNCTQSNRARPGNQVIAHHQHFGYHCLLHQLAPSSDDLDSRLVGQEDSIGIFYMSSYCSYVRRPYHTLTYGHILGLSFPNGGLLTSCGKAKTMAVL